MYRDMRRKDREISADEAMDILKNSEYGILSTVGEDGQPYATPLSYVVIDNLIYFHCAKSGQKIDNILFEKRVCFCTVGYTQPVFDNDFTTYYESTIVYGRVSEVNEDDEKIKALTILCEKYLPEHMDKASYSINKSLSRTGVYKINIEHITGKKKQKK